MRVQYTIDGMDPLMIEHMRRNIDFDNVDLLFTARKSLHNLEKSRVLKHLPGNVQMVVDSMKDRQHFLVDNVNEMFNINMEIKDKGRVILELFASAQYFVVADSLEAGFGRLGKRLVHFQSRQGIIDGIEKSLRNVYNVKFTGKIIETDGKKLRIGAN